MSLTLWCQRLCRDFSVLNTQTHIFPRKLNHTMENTQTMNKGSKGVRIKSKIMNNKTRATVPLIIVKKPGKAQVLFRYHPYWFQSKTMLPWQHSRRLQMRRCAPQTWGCCRSHPSPRKNIYIVKYCWVERFLWGSETGSQLFILMMRIQIRTLLG